MSEAKFTPGPFGILGVCNNTAALSVDGLGRSKDSQDASLVTVRLSSDGEPPTQRSARRKNNATYKAENSETQTMQIEKSDSNEQEIKLPRVPHGRGGLTGSQAETSQEPSCKPCMSETVGHVFTAKPQLSHDSPQVIQEDSIISNRASTEEPIPCPTSSSHAPNATQPRGEPWSVVEYTDQFDVVDASGSFVARVANTAIQPDLRTPEEMRAIAHRVASAPEMYEALLASVKTIDRLNDELASRGGWGDRDWDSVDSECMAYKETLAKARGEQA